LITQLDAKAHRSRIPATEAQRKQPHTLQLITVGNLVTIFLEPRITKLGLNITQMLVLLAIRALPMNKAGPTSIARLLVHKRPSITSNLVALAERKLIRAIELPGKKPKYALTVAGTKVLTKVDIAVSANDQFIRLLLPVKEFEFLNQKIPKILGDLHWNWKKQQRS
jgi:DNA-binding MarR family transcriptional regulator